MNRQIFMNTHFLEFYLQNHLTEKKQEPIVFNLRELGLVIKIHNFVYIKYLNIMSKIYIHFHFMPVNSINYRDYMLGHRVHHLCSFCFVLFFFSPINRKICSIFRHSCIQFLLESWLFLIYLPKLNQFGLLQNSSMVYRTSGISYLLGFVWHDTIYHHLCWHNS